MRVWDEPGSTSPHSPPYKGGEGGGLKFSIEDTGIGIPEDKLSQVFDRFMQVDTSSTRAYGGMGIGLSLVKDFVALHGGTRSRPGTDVKEIAEGLVVDFDEKGHITGIDIQHASKILDLKTLETVDLPAVQTRIAS